MELVRDYLFLASRKKIKKEGYREKMKLASDLLTSLHRSEENWSDQLLEDYLTLSVDYLAEYLDLNIKHYVCPGSGDSYRNWKISRDGAGITIELLVEDFEEEKSKISKYVESNLLYPMKILFVKAKSLPNCRPRYH